MKYFDSHAHYYDDRFREEITESVDELIGALFASSVSEIINVATSPENAPVTIAQAQKYPNMYTALGIHPYDAAFFDKDPTSAVNAIRTLVKDKSSKCVAIGEIGLDYHYEGIEKDRQIAYFEAQMALARELDMPVVIHDRDSHEDVISVMKKFPDVIGVLHSFSGSAEMAKEVIRMGYYVSVSGTVTFKNARKPKEVVAAIPRDRLLIETDCPYLAPHPHRGKINHSGYLSYTNATVAEIWGIDEASAAEITAENARRLFRIK